MKNFFLTLDLEEWYHLEYFQKLDLEKQDIFVKLLNDFFDLLDKYNIKITIFALAELANKYPEIIKSIAERGHEISCHGLNHQLLYEKTDEQLEIELVKAREILQGISGQEVLGYRAPCYSMDDDKLDILERVGFLYDSSFIQFAQHDLYKVMKLDGFVKLDDLIYEKSGFYEFEIPTLPILKYNIPISGGGYFRLLPFILFKRLFNKFSKQHNNFLFYIHPFEVAYQKIKLPDVNLFTKFRFSVRRKSVLKNLEKFIVYLLKNGYSFHKLIDFIK